MRKIAVLGPGLLGGSIALAVQQKMPETRVAIWARRKEAVDELRRNGILGEASSDLEPIVSDAELVIFCVPIGAMQDLANVAVQFISENAVITDVGSVKAPVVETLGEIFRSGKFIGSHPIAGSERSGIEAARADLFENANCMITPTGPASPADVTALSQFWLRLGCNVRSVTPVEHDEIMALVSHLPHLLAAALVNLVCAQNADSLNCSGNGFRDATRVASGPPEMWSEILLTNRHALKKSIDAMSDQLHRAAKMLDQNQGHEMQEFLAAAKNHRDVLRPIS
jgi:prephenate dehydrogenase